MRGTFLEHHRPSEGEFAELWSEAHAADRRGADLSAAFRFPDNFERADVAEPGSYSYS
jgi:hypothetical protein